ncbi:MAG: TolC family protein, partial [Elusimicrobiales bacterium]|nr:TolC family protein [Elusimicrobiales bacterium]
MIKDLSILVLFFMPLSLSSIELTLADCIKLAFENNPTLKTKISELKSAEFSYYASMNNYYPKLSFSWGFSRSGGEKRNPSNSFSASTSFSQNIFSYNSLYSIRSAKINYDIAKLNYENYLVELRKSLYTAFYNLFFAQDLVSVNEKIVEIRKANAELINLKYESGFESKGNMLYAKAQYEMAKLNLEKAKQQLEIASNNLKNIIGMNITEQIKVKNDIIIKSSDVEMIYEDLDSIIFGLPQYKIYQKNIELAKEKIKNSKLDWLPSLNFSASRSYSGKNFFPDNSSWSLGVSMSMPIFSSGITYRKNNVLVMKEGLKSAEEKLRDFLISQKNSIMNAYSDYKIALNSLETYKI